MENQAVAGKPGKAASKNRRMSSVWRVVPVFARMRFVWLRAVASVILSFAAVDDLVPAGGIDGGIVDCRDQIAIGV
ncbi:MAG: hypothetical protein CR217_13955 [Beijerinckiaceae bacterium]|nr:MAG: hypothetical protein CR217_13955 [Beijerinckiaceae bacterium]